MRIVVCVRKGLDGELGPFDAAAYEEALRIQGAEVILLTMGPQTDEEPLLRLTRLGAARAVLLSDKAFAGADTLATAYTLSLAIKRLKPDLVFCGRQTLIGDTGQTGIMLASLAELSPITGVMQIREISENAIECLTRGEGEVKEKLPALLCFERTNALRLPRLRSKLGSLEIWDAKALDADLRRCGLIGSPTRVLKSFENQSGKRKCTYISRKELSDAIQKGLQRMENTAKAMQKSEEKLPEIYMVGEAPRAFAESVSDTVHVIPLTDADQIASEIQKKNPAAVLWGCDAKSKRICATVAARLGLGLCADCTALGCEDGELMMYRPALSGSVIAKIQSLSRPAMATVRTESDTKSDIIVTAGAGVQDRLGAVQAFADSIGAQLCASRKLVDEGLASYDMQVGLTGKTVSPPVYIAIGVSGAVHHIAGMQRAGTVIAINPDPDAPIFEYADYGIVDQF